jgi:hypothetical protein
MAKPINLYQGAAPAAMAQMGQGLSEAGANIGRSLQQGYQSLGQGLAGGISAAAGAYKEYKDLQSQVKGSEKMFKSLKSYLPKDVQTAFDSQIQELNTNGSLKDKAAFYEQAKSFLGTSVGQTFQMQKQKQELDAAAARQKTSEAAARDRTVLTGQTQFDIEQLRQKYKAQQGAGVNFGMDPISGGAGNSSSYYNSLFGE